MLGAALTFILLALLAAVFGFEIIASGFATLAQFAFFLFVALAIISLIANFVQGVDDAVT
ncbi:MAG: DUF1328 domain-containing protein [Chloroflexi bacterium]|nr:DUF1328 domain-containing protein [Chloroflexota bacterium]